jgi:hypothetical protein
VRLRTRLNSLARWSQLRNSHPPVSIEQIDSGRGDGAA